MSGRSASLAVESSATGYGEGWLLPLRGGRFVTVGQREIVYLLPDMPKLFPVPLAPRRTPGVMLWHGRPIVVLDLSAVHAHGAGAAAAGSGIVAVVAYSAPQAVDGSEFGALLLAGVPRRVEVSDADALDPGALGDGCEPWLPYLDSAFAHVDYGPVPILNLARVFDGDAAGLDTYDAVTPPGLPV